MTFNAFCYPSDILMLILPNTADIKTFFHQQGIKSGFIRRHGRLRSHSPDRPKGSTVMEYLSFNIFYHRQRVSLSPARNVFVCLFCCCGFCFVLVAFLAKEPVALIGGEWMHHKNIYTSIYLSNLCVHVFVYNNHYNHHYHHCSECPHLRSLFIWSKYRPL